MNRSRRLLALFIIGTMSLSSSTLWAKPSDIFSHLGNDAKELVTRWPALVLLGGGALAGILTTTEKHFDSTWNTNNARSGLNHALDIVGSPYSIDGAATVVFAAGALSHHTQLAVTGETLLEALFLTEGTTGVLKYAVNRQRPNGGSHSFPSGHAARTFAAATVLETLYGPKIGLPSYALAGWISFSRLDAHAHFLSDVVFGSALGASIGWATARFHKRTGKMLISPLVGEGSGLAVSGNF